jgi:hypothetical protein
MAVSASRTFCGQPGEEDRHAAERLNQVITHRLWCGRGHASRATARADTHLIMGLSQPRVLNNIEEETPGWTITARVTCWLLATDS